MHHKFAAPPSAEGQIYIFGYISRPRMGTFNLHISWTQAMCSPQYRHVQAIYETFPVYIKEGAAEGRPPCIYP